MVLVWMLGILAAGVVAAPVDVLGYTLLTERMTCQGWPTPRAVLVQVGIPALSAPVCVCRAHGASCEQAELTHLARRLTNTTAVASTLWMQHSPLCVDRDTYTCMYVQILHQLCTTALHWDE